MENLDKNTRLFKSLASLSQKTPYHEISISTLCQQAGVSRMYFYRHFSTFDGIITQHINDDFLHFLQRINHRPVKNIETFNEIFFRVLEPDLPELAIFLKGERADLVQIVFQNDLTELTKIDALPFPKIKNSYWQAYVTGGLTRILVTWFGKEHPESAQEMGRLITQIVE